LTAAEQEQWLKEVLAVIADPAHAAFFGPSSAAEVPIVGVVDGRPLSGQVDRLAVTEEAVHVIDYKTNRPAPMTQGTVPAAYRRQMAAYRRVLSGIYPDRPIHCALLWTDGPRLLWLHEEDDTASP
jgi:ATP-dependent helicase/nuclease subunit A